MKIDHWNGSQVGIVAAFAMIAVSGCSRDVRLADQKLRDVQVGTVTHYGITLDQDASPKQVAFVLLRAMREDFEATSEAEREAALDVLFDVAAANELQKFNTTGLTREEALFNFVYHWTPAVSHYTEQFPTEWERAESRFLQVIPKADPDKRSPEESQVLLEVDDPGGDPNGGAVLVVSLVKDKGYWRVLRVGFAPKLREIPGRKREATEPPPPSAPADDE